ENTKPKVTYKNDFCIEAEDGIRGRNVTGVQTCAHPIFRQDFIIRYQRLMEVAGSPKACRYFSFDPQPSMFSSIGVQVFHWKSRVFIAKFLPPKIPSMSDVMFGCPESPEPI